jgi:hypothetical protein
VPQQTTCPSRIDIPTTHATRHNKCNNHPMKTKNTTRPTDPEDATKNNQPAPEHQFSSPELLRVTVSPYMFFPVTSDVLFTTANFFIFSPVYNEISLNTTNQQYPI